MHKKLVSKIILSAILIVSIPALSVHAQDKSEANSKTIAKMSKRISDLEAQVLNMQVMIGTLESLVKQQRGSSQASSFQPGSGGAGVSSDRIETLETQLRALAAQVERIGSGAGSGNSGQSGFGNTTVAPDNSARRIGSSQLSSVSGSQGEEGESVMMYEQAKSHLLRRDYAAAEAAFKDFLVKYKQDALAGEAQYWLGESYFKQDKYKQAADSFLKGYSKYRQSKKAPNSLFKLALALNRLGQKKAACTTFTELKNTYPDMGQSLLQRVNREASRIKC